MKSLYFLDRINRDIDATSEDVLHANTPEAMEQASKDYAEALRAFTRLSAQDRKRANILAANVYRSSQNLPLLEVS